MDAAGLVAGACHRGWARRGGVGGAVMNVTFSCAHPLSGDGPARPLSRIHAALQREFGKRYRFVSPETPQVKEVLGDVSRLGEANGPAFDDVVSHVDPNRVGLFLGCGGASLHQIYARGGGQSGTLWFSSHWAYADRVLRGEYARFGIMRDPIHPYVKWRAQMEQERSDFIIVPSQRCKSTYPEEIQEKTHVVEFGVDSELFHPPAQPRAGHLHGASAPLKVLFPATNPPRKGLRRVLDAFARLPRDRFQLTLTGCPSLDFGRLGERLPPIVSTGWVSSEEMRRLYQDHDVLLLPSVEEGQALAVLEAAASGMPSITTSETGYTPMEANDAGWRVASGDAAVDLASALTRADEDRDHLASLGRQAREWAESRPWSLFEDGVIQVLREVAR